MPYPHRAEEYLGKCIEGILVTAHRSGHAGGRPVMQVILFFTDGTSGEIYSNPNGDLALAHVTACRYENYRLQETVFQVLYRRLRRSAWNQFKSFVLRTARRARRGLGTP